MFFELCKQKFILFLKNVAKISRNIAVEAGKKFFRRTYFFSNITINHKLILLIIRKDCPKSNPKRRTATKRSNRSAAFDYNILLCFIKLSRFRQSIPSFRTLRRKNIETQHKHPSLLYYPQLHFAGFGKRFFILASPTKHIFASSFSTLYLSYLTRYFYLHFENKTQAGIFLRLLKQQERFVS